MVSRGIFRLLQRLSQLAIDCQEQRKRIWLLIMGHLDAADFDAILMHTFAANVCILSL